MLSVRDALADNGAVRAYQRDRLGRSDGESLLLELMPLPARSIAHWAPYDLLFENFPNRVAYFDTLLAGSYRSDSAHDRIWAQASGPLRVGLLAVLPSHIPVDHDVAA